MLKRPSLLSALGLVLTLMTGPALAQEPKAKAKGKAKGKSAPAEEAPVQEVHAASDNPGAVTKISMNGLSAKAGAYYRLELRRDDHGLEATEGYTPSGTTTVKVNDFKLGLDGEMSARLSYAVLIDVVNADTLELGKVLWAFNPQVTFILGVDYVNQGGYENRFQGYNSIYLSPYCAALMPLPTSAPTFSAQAKVAGTVTLQLIEDQPTAGSADPKMQPAVTLEWLGQYGEIAPLAQVGVYGNGNSKFLALGVNYANKTMQATFDYVMDFHSTRYGGGSNVKRLDTVYNNIVLEGWYKNLTAAEPFVKFMAFAAVEPDDKDFGLEDISYNSQGPDGEAVLDDNANILSLGARVPMEGDDLVPYAALDLVTATFQKPGDPTATEDRGQIILQLGVAGAL